LEADHVSDTTTPRIRGVLFDLWGTLVVDDPAVSEQRSQLRARMTRDALACLGFHYQVPDIAAAFMAAGTEHERLHAGERDLTAHGRTVLYLRHLDETLGARLDDDAWSALDEAILTPALSFGPSVMPGAAEVLADVKARGLPVVLVSNAGITPGFVLSQILDAMGLLAPFDATIFSDEVELAKPAPAIFEHALARIRLEPHEAAFVGDQPLLDVFGARRAGLWSIQLGDLASMAPEPGDLDPAHREPHARIASLADLIPTLQALRLLD
jgi:putative hydrolase of the HAD superfamily